MSHTAKAPPPAKFTGFTNLFKKLHEKEVNKKIDSSALKFPSDQKNSELLQEQWSKSETNCSFFDDIPQYVQKLKEIPIESIKIEDKHFKPSQYYVWFENKFRTALGRHKIVQCTDHESQEDENDEKIFLKKLKWYITQNEYCYKKYFDSFQCKDQENKLKNNQDSVKHFRNLNNYPQKYQFDLVNRRMQKLLSKQDNNNQPAKMDSVRIHTYPPDYDKKSAERRELTKYINEVTKSSNRKLNFQPKNFSNWYAEHSNKFEKKYCKFPKIKKVAGENCLTWLKRIKLTLDQEENSFLENKTIF